MSGKEPAPDATLQTQRKIQQEQDARDARDANAKQETKSDAQGKAVQAGARPHPERLSAQHLEKPGLEADLQLRPQFLAPDYRGSGKLEGFGTLVTGADSGIGRAVAPGPVWTPLNPADKAADEVVKFGQDTDMKRAAQPEELSPAYVFLASPVCSGYISGIVLPVTGSVGAI